ncbi:MAG: hypothetical protein ABJG68_00400 [Crocinitomicaceae bacterium]
MKKLKFIFAGAILIGALASCEKEEVTTNEEVESTSQTKEQANAGFGGSLAQFTIVDEYLYTIDYRTLNIFFLGNSEEPELTESIDMGVGMETVFHQNGRLFIGANDGVHIYDISDPRSPMEVSEFNHVTSCDPVVANDNYAFATLRGGTECGGSLSQLDIIDISDINFPHQVGQSQLINPYGLGLSNVDANILYVCDGYAGLKAYDISNGGWGIETVMERDDLEAMDVIADEDANLIVLTRGGIYQFDASNPTELVQKSVILVQ